MNSSKTSNPTKTMTFLFQRAITDISQIHFHLKVTDVEIFNVFSIIVITITKTTLLNLIYNTHHIYIYKKKHQTVEWCLVLQTINTLMSWDLIGCLYLWPYNRLSLENI